MRLFYSWIIVFCLLRRFRTSTHARHPRIPTTQGGNWSAVMSSTAHLDRLEEKLCSCWEPNNANHSITLAGSQKCFDNVRRVSNETVLRLSNIDKKWLLSPSGCRRKDYWDKAFRQAVLSRGDPGRLAVFEQKLQQCTRNPITIVVFGGSETEGNGCQLTNRGHPVKGPPTPTQFLDLSNVNTTSNQYVLGNSLCPWPNRLKTILRKLYPKCEHVDIYNVASGATDSGWALGHLQEYFNADNGARGGNKLKDVVDLIVVDYAVNDGHFLDKRLLQRLGLKQTEDDALKRIEAITEFILKFILALPSQPAVVYLETASPEQHFDASVAHLEGAQRYGVPVASFRDVLSFPDDPHWVTFSADNKKSKFGFYRVSGIVQDGRLGPENRDRPHLSLKEGPRLTVRGKWERSHNFLHCWGDTPHPLWGIHALIAEVLVFFVTVEAAAAAIMISECEKVGKVFKHAMPSSEANTLEVFLDPNRICPMGSLSHYNSENLFRSNLALPNLGANERSGWTLVSDRPGKFGWVLDKPIGSAAHDTITFEVNISSSPHITVEYMHSYEGQGKVLMSVTGPTTNHTTRRSSKVAEEILLPGETIEVDGHQPDIRYALYTEREISPFGVLPGLANLHVTLVQLSRNETNKRGGSSFKIVSVRSC